jgi:hypothetical protein
MKKTMVSILWVFSCCTQLNYISAQENQEIAQPAREFKYQAKNFDSLLGKIDGLDDAL